MLFGWKKSFCAQIVLDGVVWRQKICGLQLGIFEKEFMWDQFKKFLKLSILAPRQVCPSRKDKALALFWLCLSDCCKEDSSLLDDTAGSRIPGPRASPNDLYE